jgi:RNA polymerase sigma-70 factor (ECF subfamily)
VVSEATILPGKDDFDHLAVAISARDQAAMATLYDALAPRAFGIAYRILGDRGAAEDALQDAFLTVWRQAEQIDRARGKLVSYVLTIVHHRAVDIARRKQGIEARRASVDPADLHLLTDDASTAILSDVDATAIRSCLKRLSREQREAIEMAYFQGLTYPEIAVRLDTPLGTIKSRMRLGLARMRQELTTVGFP